MEEPGAFWTVALRTLKSTPIPLGGTRSLVSNLLLAIVPFVDCVPILHYDILGSGRLVRIHWMPITETDSIYFKKKRNALMIVY